jgi:hypothetical protein
MLRRLNSDGDHAQITQGLCAVAPVRADQCGLPPKPPPHAIMKSWHQIPGRADDEFIGLIAHGVMVGIWPDNFSI